MRIRHVLLVGAAAVVGYQLLNRDDQTGHAASEVGASTTTHHRTRTVIQQVENNAHHAPFPLNVVLEGSAKVVGKRLDR